MLYGVSYVYHAVVSLLFAITGESIHADEEISGIRRLAKKIFPNDAPKANVNDDKKHNHSPNGDDKYSELFQRASVESMGFFDDIPASSWNLMKKRYNSLPNHRIPHEPMMYSEEPFKWYQVNWEPNFSCLNELLVGGVAAGPKWICNPHRIREMNERHDDDIAGEAGGAAVGPKCLVYSIGSNDNLMFERALQQLVGVDTCEIHVFDEKGYVGELPSHVHFHSWGVKYSGSNKTIGNSRSIQESVQLLGHEGRNVEVLKVDCDGCEWTTFPDWFDSNLPDIRQIVVEVHQTSATSNEFFNRMQKEGYVTFHKEPSAWAADGTCQEYSFLKLGKAFFDM